MVLLTDSNFDELIKKLNLEIGHEKLLNAKVC